MAFWERVRVLIWKNFVLAGLVLAASSNLAEAAELKVAEPKVVVTLKPIHSLVAQVMQGVAEPLLIVDGSASPHTFTLKPSAARAINEASVFIRISEAMEPFTRKMAAALPRTVKLISLVDAPGMTLLPQRHGDTFEQHEHHEAGREDHDDDAGNGTAKDGHIWLDPGNAKAIVVYVAKVLSDTYPESAAAFAANAATATAKIDAMTQTIESQLTPYKDRSFVAFHDATQYFEARFGLAAAGSVTVTPDVQPSAKRLTAVRRKIMSLNTACVFAEPGFQPNLVAAVTEGTTAHAGTLDPEGITLAAGPDMYASLMLAMAANIKTCFEAPERTP
jgi:zinc transport system substrate-binding protein